jgi:hypothetical protein
VDILENYDLKKRKKMRIYTLLYIIALMLACSLGVNAQNNPFMGNRSNRVGHGNPDVTMGNVPNGQVGHAQMPFNNRQAGMPMQVENVASAPSFVQPVAVETEGGFLEADFPVDNPRFAWLPPTANNAPTARFVYDFRMMRVIPGQEIYDAAERGAVAFQQLGLLTPSCIIPQNVVVSLKESGTELYVVRVTARLAPGSPRVAMTNGGRSQIMVLKLKSEPVQINE